MHGGNYALSGLEAPFVPSDDSNKWRRFNLRGYRSCVGLDHYDCTSNGWAFEHSRLSLWFPNDGKFWRKGQRRRLSDSRASHPRPLSSHQNVTDSVFSSAHPVSNATNCATLFSALESELEDVGASAKEQEQRLHLLPAVACTGKRRSHGEEDMLFERLRKRANCH
ncbi:hypothetical protein FISHEDRAFT_75186 [Fistulina hepatica ATCC 64428]|uniref:Uncharacterized protein n=1 Tax=Fistulina hepatica ATCC 64428 TaxID=1128425 RepID=A0A0D7A803_9AGAR|nr:hypothetical protein FISHEDRAFT_75186 [Fistulina hepatica ATCC 64428]